MTAVIFGANGQDGFYLSRLLSAENITVIPVSRKGEAMHIDVADREAVRELIAGHQPGYIFHLAANSTTRHDVLFENHATVF